MKTQNLQDPNREQRFIELAINTIRLNAIDNRVHSVRLDFERIHEMMAIPAKAVVRTMSFSKFALRIAAVLFILISSATVYKYVTVNSLSLYNKQFKGYELGTTRGGTKPDLQDFTYQTANWLDVIAINNLAPVKTNKSRFLAGMAQMELKKYAAAIELFQEVLANNTDDRFRDDAEYYTALGYLASHQTEPALVLINQIRAKPDHKYYFLVRNMSPLDLKIIGIKK
jgi:hypothetical protein